MAAQREKAANPVLTLSGEIGLVTASFTERYHSQCIQITNDHRDQRYEFIDGRCVAEQSAISIRSLWDQPPTGDTFGWDAVCYQHVGMSCSIQKTIDGSRKLATRSEILWTGIVVQHVWKFPPTEARLKNHRCRTNRPHSVIASASQRKSRGPSRCDTCVSGTNKATEIHDASGTCLFFAASTEARSTYQGYNSRDRSLNFLCSWHGSRDRHNFQVLPLSPDPIVVPVPNFCCFYASCLFSRVDRFRSCIQMSDSETRKRHFQVQLPKFQEERGLRFAQKALVSTKRPIFSCITSSITPPPSLTAKTAIATEGFELNVQKPLGTSRLVILR